MKGSATGRSRLKALRLAPLAAALAVSGLAWAETITVGDCSDDPGDALSLRSAVAAAHPGDTVDASHLSCSTITLTTGSPAKSNGPIVVDQAAPGITILGPGAGKLAIDGANADRVISHTGVGALTIDSLTVTHGKIDTALVSTPPRGGCIASYGTLSLYNTVVSNCTVTSTKTSDAIVGGGVYASGSGALHLMHSTITGNTVAHPTTKGYVFGGGMYLRGSHNVTLEYSTISNNQVSGNVAARGDGGGIFANGGTFNAYSSTFTGNIAGDQAGGLKLFYTAAATISGSTIAGNSTANATSGLFIEGGQATITNSTISGNHSNWGGGLEFKGVATATCQNSTIAFNTGGLYAYKGGTLDVESTIMAHNGTYDFWAAGSNPPTVSGAANLVMNSTSSMPAGFLALPEGTDPALAPLTHNGGPTLTHQLLAASPALGKGNNKAALPTDQRLFPRTTNGKTDIGAVEYDTVFTDGYEG